MDISMYFMTWNDLGRQFYLLNIRLQVRLVGQSESIWLFFWLVPFWKVGTEPGLNLNQVNVTKTGPIHVQYRSDSEPSTNLFNIEIHLNLTSGHRQAGFILGISQLGFHRVGFG